MLMYVLLASWLVSKFTSRATSLDKFVILSQVIGFDLDFGPY